MGVCACARVLLTLGLDIGGQAEYTVKPPYNKAGIQCTLVCHIRNELEWITSQH